MIGRVMVGRAVRRQMLELILCVFRARSLRQPRVCSREFFDFEDNTGSCGVIASGSWPVPKSADRQCCVRWDTVTAFGNLEMRR